MRILIVHNHYGDYAVGGEAMVMRAEADMLRSKGHDVFVYERSNSELVSKSIWAKFISLMNSDWSKEGYCAVAKVIDEFKPDVMHVHNYKYLLSPSVFKAAKDKGVKTCLTLHNYRLACPAGMFLCRGKVCEDCFDGLYYRMLWRRCVSNNLLNNLAQFNLYRGTKKRNLLDEWVDGYICLSEFARRKFLQAGVNELKLHVKPNFIIDPLGREGVSCEGRGAVFVGRLSSEKGVSDLLKAWDGVDYPLTIIGDGPLRQKLENAAPANVKFTGLMNREGVVNAMSNCAFVVFQSNCYEGFPITLLEAMALCKPVIASDLGARREIVTEGVTGLLFEAGNVSDMKNVICKMINDKNLCKDMGSAGRRVYLDRYVSEVNYKQLIEIYSQL